MVELKEKPHWWVPIMLMIPLAITAQPIVTDTVTTPLVLRVEAVETTADTAQTTAENAQDELNNRFKVVPNAADPSGACGYGAGENGFWVKTNAAQTSSRFCWCSDEAADEWACVTGAIGFP